MRTFTEYLRYQEYDCKHIRIHLKTVVTFENRTINEDSVGSSFNSFTEKSNEMAWADPGGWQGAMPPPLIRHILGGKWAICQRLPDIWSKPGPHNAKSWIRPCEMGS